jgi:hypothetical protein
MLWRSTSYSVLSSRNEDRLYRAALACLLKRPWKNYRLMQVVVNTFYSNIPESVRNRVCPFCGKSFSRWHAAYNHVRRVHKEELKAVVADCAEKYLALARNIVVYASFSSDKHRNIVKIRGVNERFSRVSEAIDFLMRNPDIVRKILDSNPQPRGKVTS